jgi:hypothetical protein
MKAKVYLACYREKDKEYVFDGWADISDFVRDISITDSIEKASHAVIGIVCPQSVFDRYIYENIECCIKIDDEITGCPYLFGGYVVKVDGSVNLRVFEGRISLVSVEGLLINWHSFRAKMKKSEKAEALVDESSARHIFITEFKQDPKKYGEFVPIPLMFRETEGGVMSTGYFYAHKARRDDDERHKTWFKPRNSKIVLYFAEKMKSVGLLSDFLIYKSYEARELGTDTQQADITDSQYLAKLGAEIGYMFFVREFFDTSDSKVKEVKSYMFFVPISFAGTQYRVLSFSSTKEDGLVLDFDFNLMPAGKKFQRLGLPVWKTIYELETDELRKLSADKKRYKMVLSVLEAKVSVISDTFWRVGLGVRFDGSFPKRIRGIFGIKETEEAVKRAVWYVTGYSIHWNVNGDFKVGLELTTPSLDKYSFVMPPEVVGKRFYFSDLKSKKYPDILPDGEIEIGGGKSKKLDKDAKKKFLKYIWGGYDLFRKSY